VMSAKGRIEGAGVSNPASKFLTSLHAILKRVTDGTRTRALRSHNPMRYVPIRTRVSGN
jgi:hypothetical protein